MKNFGLKFAALLLACVLWFIVSGPRREQKLQRVATASLSLVGLPSDVVITTDVRSSVAVRVEGRVSALRSLASQNLEASADLSKITGTGDVVITLRPKNINVPEDIEVLDIVPNKVRFSIEKLGQSSVSIRPFLDGDPPEGYLVGQPVAEPDRALIEGPMSHVLKLTEVATERIIMTGRTATFVQNTPVVSDDPLVRIVRPLTTQVTVPVLAEVGPAPTDTSGTTGTPPVEPTTTTDKPDDQ
ncbi:MAG TPA: CdaR family protein [Thermoanaerobaculia bacterium]|nr:CdaR family protein [Thermoanaerobaculia bacterium]